MAAALAAMALLRITPVVSAVLALNGRLPKGLAAAVAGQATVVVSLVSAAAAGHAEAVGQVERRALAARLILAAMERQAAFV